MSLLNKFKKSEDQEGKNSQKKESSNKKEKTEKEEQKKTDSGAPLRGSVLKRPLVSEKSTRLTEDNKYVFIVENWANKNEIKKEVEERWNVKVESVNTIKNKDKIRKLARRGGGKITGSSSSFKKAIVTLVEGDSLDIFSV